MKQATSSGAASSAPPRAIGDDIAREEVAAVYRVVDFAVLAAVTVAAAMSAILTELGLSDARRSLMFVAYLSVLATAHMILKRGYLRAADRTSTWRRWGRMFVAVAFFEGIGWGWICYGLVAPGDYQAQIFCLLTLAGVAVSAIPFFAAYLSAFIVFFVPAVAPIVILDILGNDPLQRGTGLLVLIYFTVMLFFGISFNRWFRRLVSLRLHAETLADELRVQVDIAEAANRAKSSFLAAASHDLRQPVHAIGLFVGALRGMTISADAREGVEQIETASQAMNALFAALLDISRLDAGIVEVERHAFPIGPMLSRICAEHAGEATAKGLRLGLRPSSLSVFSDPILTEQVLRHLVSNAIRHTKRGRVLVGCRRRGASVAVQVFDTGSGIPLGQRERIFDEYYQLGNAERDRAKGLGLGLAIVRRTVGLLGCELSLRSDVDRGSCFGITLPIAIDPAAPADEAPSTVEASSTESRLIVFIDDEAHIRSAMSLLMRGWGYTLLAVASAEEAVEQLARHPVCPQLIISDLRLGGAEGGIAAIEVLRSEYNHQIPAFLVTGDTAPERLIEARNSGLLLLHKPLSSAALRNALVTTLERADHELQQSEVPPDDHGLRSVDDLERLEDRGDVDLDGLF